MIYSLHVCAIQWCNPYIQSYIERTKYLVVFTVVLTCFSLCVILYSHFHQPGDCSSLPSDQPAL